jgi:predicted NBD/HSP70 family sugar kinase
MSCIVVDLGGTNLRCGIVSNGGDLITQERTRLYAGPDTRAETFWEDIVSTIAAFVTDHETESRSHDPIVVAFPGPVRDDRAVGQAPTLVGSGIVPDIVADIRAITGREVMMLNDVSAAAWYFERALVADRFAVVTVSSGIGSKIFDRGGMGVIDDTPYAGEIGHLIVDAGEDAEVCDCGGHGHLGAIASGRGFERIARRAADSDKAGFRASACVQVFGATRASLNNEVHLVPAIVAGDTWATALLRASIAPLAQVLRTLTIGCGLQAVAVMGGFAQRIGSIYARELSAALGSFSDCGAACVNLQNFVTVVGAGEEPGLIGAARYAEHRLSRC